MNGLTATGITVGICAGVWQLISSHVGLQHGWELLGTIGFVAFCSFYAAGGVVNPALSKACALTIPGQCGRAGGAGRRRSRLSQRYVGVLGKRYYHGAVFGSHRLAGALYANLIYSRRLPRHDALFRHRFELDGDIAGVSGGQLRWLYFRI